ncbi:4-Coumarate:CoA ligase [Corchorus capsularis]|uniref:4-Coumarate:CoA ligase n=1 Tax=Corchorus capsularis TaxID=210143 RepID=A0A1R3IV30_COCAP|nr:4-Coumarate:CoA ligase [Corchorus capsularis]
MHEEEEAEIIDGLLMLSLKVEAMLIAYPEITDADVIAMEDEAAREVHVAFVVRSKKSEITEDKIKQYISEQFLIGPRLLLKIQLSHLTTLWQSLLLYPNSDSICTFEDVSRI